MSPSTPTAIEEILDEAHAEGRTSLYEHECYGLLEAIGAEAAPANRLIPIGHRPTAADLDHLTGDKVVLKVVSPDITHKTEAKGVRIVAREIGAVEAAFDLMMREVPETYAAYLENHEGEVPAALAGRRGHGLEQRVTDRIVGILLCSFMPPDSQGFATELFVGIRHTEEFGPIISAGLGGVEMETPRPPDQEGRRGRHRAHRHRRRRAVLRALPQHPELRAPVRRHARIPPAARRRHPRSSASRPSSTSPTTSRR